MSSQKHKIPYMELITFHDSSRGKFLAGFLKKTAVRAILFCRRSGEKKKIFINGIFLIEGEQRKVEKVLEVFSSCSDNL